MSWSCCVEALLGAADLEGPRAAAGARITGPRTFQLLGSVVLGETQVEGHDVQTRYRPMPAQDGRRQVDLDGRRGGVAA